MAEPKGGLAYIPETSQEAIQANKAYQDALERLNKSLEARQNRMFDPTMLALAEGFLTPGRTGSFGESLGVAAGKMRAAEEEEGKTEMALAQAKLGLAERGIALEQQRQRERQFKEALEGAPGGASVGVAASAPAGARPGVSTEEPSQRPEDRLAQAVSDTPPAVQGMVGIQVFPPTQNLVTSRSLLMQRYREGKMSLGDALAEAAKLENDRYVFRDNSVLDKLTGRMFFSPTGGTQRIMTSKGPMELPTDLIRLGRPELIEQYIKNLPSTAEVAGGEAGARAGAERRESGQQIEVMLPRADGTYGSYKISVDAAFELGRLINKHGINSPEVLQFAAKQTGEAAPAGGVPSTVPGAAPGVSGGVRLGVPSQQQQAIDTKAAELTAQERVKFNEAQRTKIIEASDDATEAMRRAAIFRQYADAPDANAIFGILSNDKVMSIAARLLEQGIGVSTPGGRFAVGIPEIQTIIRNSSLSPEQQAKAQVAFQLMVESQIKMSQYAKGAVSNYEQQLFAQSGINKEDIPGSIRMKSDMITLRGQFDKDVARKFEDSNQDVRTFKRSEWYQNRLKQYDEDLMKVASGNRLKVPGSSAPQVSVAQPRLKYNPSTGQWSE